MRTRQQIIQEQIIKVLGEGGFMSGLADELMSGKHFVSQTGNNPPTIHGPDGKQMDPSDPSIPAHTLRSYKAAGGEIAVPVVQRKEPTRPIGSATTSSRTGPGFDPKISYPAQIPSRRFGGLRRGGPGGDAAQDAKIFAAKRRWINPEGDEPDLDLPDLTG